MFTRSLHVKSTSNKYFLIWIFLNFLNFCPFNWSVKNIENIKLQIIFTILFRSSQSYTKKSTQKSVICLFSTSLMIFVMFRVYVIKILDIFLPSLKCSSSLECFIRIPKIEIFVILKKYKYMVYTQMAKRLQDFMIAF